MLLVCLPGIAAVSVDLWRHDLSAAGLSKTKLTYAATEWGREALVVECVLVSCIAGRRGGAWDAANTAILEAGQPILIEHPGRVDGVVVIGVDEHVWRHTTAATLYCFVRVCHRHH